MFTSNCRGFLFSFQAFVRSFVPRSDDALAVVTGAGVFNVGSGADVSGTVTSFRVVTDHHLYDPLRRIYVNPYLGKNRWLAGGSNNLGGGIIEWLRQFLFPNDPEPYERIEQEAHG